MLDVLAQEDIDKLLEVATKDDKTKANLLKNRYKYLYKIYKNIEKL